MIIQRMQIKSNKAALEIVKNKPCRICGQPSSCAVRDNGIQPACLDHGLMAQKLGYIVTFPGPKNG
jgi:hypothetical protein